MSKKDYKHIYYRNCPHFTVGLVNQWGENGYLFFEGEVYEYHEDRKGQYGETFHPRGIQDFLAYAKHEKIKIPSDFMKVLESE